MARKKTKRNIADLVITNTYYGALIDVAVKDDFHISELNSGHLLLVPKGDFSMNPAIIYGSNTLLGRYEGFGMDNEAGEKYIKLKVIGKPGTLEIKKSQIESITLYKGKEYKF